MEDDELIIVSEVPGIPTQPSPEEDFECLIVSSTLPDPITPQESKVRNLQEARTRLTEILDKDGTEWIAPLIRKSITYITKEISTIRLQLRRGSNQLEGELQYDEWESDEDDAVCIMGTEGTAIKANGVDYERLMEKATASHLLICDVKGIRPTVLGSVARVIETLQEAVQEVEYAERNIADVYNSNGVSEPNSVPQVEPSSEASVETRSIAPVPPQRSQRRTAPWTEAPESSAISAQSSNSNGGEANGRASAPASRQEETGTPFQARAVSQQPRSQPAVQHHVPTHQSQNAILESNPGTSQLRGQMPGGSHADGGRSALTPLSASSSMSFSSQVPATARDGHVFTQAKAVSRPQNQTVYTTCPSKINITVAAQLGGAADKAYHLRPREIQWAIAPYFEVISVITMCKVNIVAGHNELKGYAMMEVVVPPLAAAGSSAGETEDYALVVGGAEGAIFSTVSELNASCCCDFTGLSELKISYPGTNSQVTMHPAVHEDKNWSRNNHPISLGSYLKPDIRTNVCVYFSSILHQADMVTGIVKIKTQSIESMISRVLARSRQPTSKRRSTRKKAPWKSPVKRRRGNAEEDDDEELATDSVSIAVADPISGSRISIPVRGKQCQHPPCFDLKAFLRFNLEQTKNFKCAHCDNCFDQYEFPSGDMRCGTQKDRMPQALEKHGMPLKDWARAAIQRSSSHAQKLFLRRVNSPLDELIVDVEFLEILQTITDDGVDRVRWENEAWTVCAPQSVQDQMGEASSKNFKSSDGSAAPVRLTGTEMDVDISEQTVASDTDEEEEAELARIEALLR